VLPDGALEVEQRASLPGRVVEHSQAGALRLGAVYWREVRALTLGLVRTRPDGDGVEVRALGVALFRFERAETHVTDIEVSCAFAIRGGLLARGPGGSLTLAQEAVGPVIRSTITGYSARLAAREGRPRWTGALYNQVQGRLHLAVSRRYFRRLIEESAP
jgi:hypothetical protein